MWSLFPLECRVVEPLWFVSFPTTPEAEQGWNLEAGSRHNLNCLDIKEPPETLCRAPVLCEIQRKKNISFYHQIADGTHKIY